MPLADSAFADDDGREWAHGTDLRITMPSPSKTPRAGSSWIDRGGTFTDDCRAPAGWDADRLLQAAVRTSRALPRRRHRRHPPSARPWPPMRRSRPGRSAAVKMGHRPSPPTPCWSARANRPCSQSRAASATRCASATKTGCSAVRPWSIVKLPDAAEYGGHRDRRAADSRRRHRHRTGHRNGAPRPDSSAYGRGLRSIAIVLDAWLSLSRP